MSCRSHRCQAPGQGRLWAVVLLLCVPDLRAPRSPSQAPRAPAWSPHFFLPAILTRLPVLPGFSSLGTVPCPQHHSHWPNRKAKGLARLPWLGRGRTRLTFARTHKHTLTRIHSTISCLHSHMLIHTQTHTRTQTHTQTQRYTHTYAGPHMCTLMSMLSYTHAYLHRLPHT